MKASVAAYLMPGEWHEVGRAFQGMVKSWLYAKHIVAEGLSVHPEDGW